VREEGLEFPLDDTSRHFSYAEMITEFDPAMQDHLRRIQSKEIHYHSHKI
jgi:hypothetical protein